MKFSKNAEEQYFPNTLHNQGKTKLIITLKVSSLIKQGTLSSLGELNVLLLVTIFLNISELVDAILHCTGFV